MDYMNLNPRERGEKLKKAFRADVNKELNGLTQILIDSPTAEVYSVAEVGNQDQPEFYMVTDDDVLVRFAMTGEMVGMHKITDSGLENVIEMDAQYRFHLRRNTLPVNGVADDLSKTPEQLLEDLVNYAHRKAQSAKTTGSIFSKLARYFKVVTHEAIVSRFKLMQLVREEGKGRVPIPDQSPRTIFVKAGEGCVHNCAYCDVPVDEKFKLYTVEQFESKLKFIRESMEEIITKNSGSMDQLKCIDEVFIDIADILYLGLYRGGRSDEDLLPENRLTAKRAVELVREYFPWVTKIGAFVGAKSVLDYTRKEKPVFSSDPLHQYNYSAEPLQELRRAGLNRMYLGVETAHDEGSAILNKEITYGEKLCAAKIIAEAGIGLKAIIQVGVLGNGFYKGGVISPENFVHWKEHAETTAKWVNEAQPYRVMFSTWQNRGDLKINELIGKGIVLPYEDPRQFEEEQKYLTGLINKEGRNKKSFIEPDYHKFLPKGESKLVITEN